MSGLDWSPLQNEVMDAPFPMLFGAPSTVDGYCSLEKLERSVSLETIGKHRYEVTYWYQALKLLTDPLFGIWDYPKEEPLRSTRITQSHLVGLEVSSAKGGLDLLLAGHYSLAFAAIRHMIEAVTQILYIDFFPGALPRWEPGNEAPQMRQMVDQIKKEMRKDGEEEEAERFENIYQGWKLMCKGAHPSGDGLFQIQPTDEEPLTLVGTGYRENLVYVGFDTGLAALQKLLPNIVLLDRHTEQWRQDYFMWCTRVEIWRRGVRESKDLAYIFAEVEEELSGEG